MVNMCSQFIKPDRRIEKAKLPTNKLCCIFLERETKTKPIFLSRERKEEACNKMALYVDEEEIWKCPQHPSKRRRTGICHVCLRQRLSSLCPDCANVRPCACYAATSSSSASSSSSFSRFSSSAGIGSVGLVSSLMDSEPSFRRSRSVAVPFLRSKPTVEQNYKSSSSFWSLFKRGSGNRSMREEVERRDVVVLKDEGEVGARKKSDVEEKSRRMMMRKSRSVAVTSDSGVADVIRPTKGGGKGWYFPSPIKVFKQSISRGLMVNERSPLYRG